MCSARRGYPEREASRRRNGGQSHVCTGQNPVGRKGSLDIFIGREFVLPFRKKIQPGLIQAVAYGATATCQGFCNSQLSDRKMRRRIRFPIVSSPNFLGPGIGFLDFLFRTFPAELLCGASIASFLSVSAFQLYYSVPVPMRKTPEKPRSGPSRFSPLAAAPCRGWKQEIYLFFQKTKN